MADGSTQKYNPNKPVDLFDDDYPHRVFVDEEDQSDQSKNNEDQPSVDEELESIKKIVDALRRLTQPGRERVLRWAVSRFLR